MRDDMIQTALATWAARDLPARLLASQVAKLLNCTPEDVGILVSAGKLRALKTSFDFDPRLQPIFTAPNQPISKQVGFDTLEGATHGPLGAIWIRPFDYQEHQPQRDHFVETKIQKGASLRSTIAYRSFKQSSTKRTKSASWRFFIFSHTRFASGSEKNR